MPRPPSDRVDEAFQIWATMAERNDTRTAQSAGASRRRRSTYWHRTYGWDERWQEAMATGAEMAVRQARQMMRQATPLIAQRLLDIIGGERPLLKRMAARTWTPTVRSSWSGAAPTKMPSMPPSSCSPTTSVTRARPTTSPIPTGHGIGAADTYASGRTGAGRPSEDEPQTLAALKASV